MLRGLPEWTPERVKAAMESGEDNLRVDLARPVPVFIVYATAAARGERPAATCTPTSTASTSELAELLDRGYPYAGR